MGVFRFHLFLAVGLHPPGLTVRMNSPKVIVHHLDVSFSMKCKTIERKTAKIQNTLLRHLTGDGGSWVTVEGGKGQQYKYRQIQIRIKTQTNTNTGKYKYKYKVVHFHLTCDGRGWVTVNGGEGNARAVVLSVPDCTDTSLKKNKYKNTNTSDCTNTSLRTLIYFHDKEFHLRKRSNIHIAKSTYSSEYQLSSAQNDDKYPNPRKIPNTQIHK